MDSKEEKKAIEKLNKRYKKDIVKELKPFWEKREKLMMEANRKEIALEKEMNKKLNIGIKLEFFYSDGECCGIGAEGWDKREKFPLIHEF